MTELPRTVPAGPLQETPPEGYETYFTRGGFAPYVGPVFRKLGGEGGNHTYLFTPRTHHMNAGGAVHGGMMMTLADMTMGGSVRTLLEAAPSGTISLNCDFVGPGREGSPVTIVTEVTRRTRTIVFMQATITQDGRTLMTASGIWKVLGEKPA